MLKQNCEKQNNNRINIAHLNNEVSTLRINKGRKIDSNIIRLRKQTPQMLFPTFGVQFKPKDFFLF